jgi:hypothetical protein
MEVHKWDSVAIVDVIVVLVAIVIIGIAIAEVKGFLVFLLKIAVTIHVLRWDIIVVGIDLLLPINGFQTFVRRRRRIVVIKDLPKVGLVEGTVTVVALAVHVLVVELLLLTIVIGPPHPVADIVAIGTAGVVVNPHIVVNSSTLHRIVGTILV